MAVLAAGHMRLYHLCPLLSTLRLYGMSFEQRNGPVSRWEAVRMTMVFGSFAYVAFVHFMYWSASYDADNRTDICYSLVIAGIMATTATAYLITWLRQGEIGTFMSNVVGLTTSGDQEKARSYGWHLFLLTNMVTIIRLVAGVYGVATNTKTESSVLTAPDNLEQSFVHKLAPGVVWILLFHGVCEHFAFTFMALFAYGCHAVSLSVSQWPSTDVRPSAMIAFRKRHVDSVKLIRSHDTIYSPMLLIWMLFLMISVWFCVRELKYHLTDANNLPITLLVTTRFAIYLVLISVAGKTNEKVNNCVVSLSENSESWIREEIYWERSQVVLASTVTYLHQLYCQPVGITVWGFYNVQQELVLSLLGTVFSYSFITYCLD